MRHPIFIIGSPRSGTSALVEVLFAVGYRGFLEGNFLSLLTGVHRLIESHFTDFPTDNKAVLLSNINKNHLKRQLFESFRGAVVALHPQEPWLDKTGNPEMILAIPSLRELWPSAGFIFAKRRGIENLISRMKKFPNRQFEYHCADWARNMSSWRAMREQLPAGCFIEVDQADMIRYPEAAAKKLCAFLGINEAMISEASQVMKTRRPQQSTAGSAAQTCSLALAGWSAQQIETFLKHCNGEMDAYGYTLDERYSVFEELL